MKFDAKRNSVTRWLLALAVLAPWCAARADYPTTILSDSPLGYWRLGDVPVGQAPSLTAGDVAANSGSVGAALNGYYLYNVMHPVAGALAGDPSTAAGFDGFKTRVDVPYSPLMNATNFTIELWVMMTNNVTRAVAPMANIGTNTQRGYVIYAHNGNTNWQFRTYSGANATNLTTTNLIQLNTWTHLAGTFDGTRMRFYVNGAEAAAPVTNSAFTPNTANPLRLGAAATSTTVGDYFWPGYLDEVAVYTNALSAGQILAHYQNATNASRATPYATLVTGDGPVAYWRFEEAAYVGSTAPAPAVNAGSLGAAANGVMFSVTNSTVPVPYATNGIFGGVTGVVAGDTDAALGLYGNAAGRVDVPFTAALNPKQFTIEAWAKIPSLYRDYQSILSSRDDSSAGGVTAGYIFYANNANTWQFWTASAANAWVNMTAVNAVSVTNGSWAHLVGVFDGSNKWFYVNGSLVGFAINQTHAPNAIRPLRIGGGASETPAGNYFVSGAVDEVAVYPTALTSDRVVAHYQAAVGTLPPLTTAPTFNVNPVNTTNDSLQRVTLTAGALGSLPMQFQWNYVTPDGLTTNAIPGATNNVLVLNPTSTNNTGWYFASAVNGLGAANSTTVFVQIWPPSVPTLVYDVPASVPVYAGGNARVPVLVSGTPPISYQWLSNNVPLPGQTNTSLLISNVTVANGAQYSLALSNALGQTTSASAVLNVMFPRPSVTAAIMTNLHPLAYWRLGETAATYAFDSWQGYHGLYFNALPHQVPGAVADDDDGACMFTGTGSYMQMTNSAPFNFNGTNAFTLTVWAMPNALTGIQRLFSNRSTGGYGMGFNGNNRIRLTGFGVKDVDSSVGSFNVGQWYHIAVVHFGTTSQFYVNGALVSTDTTTLTTINSSTAPLQLGGNPTASEYFNGQMDEAAVFNRALSAAEIASIYAAQYGSLLAPSIVKDVTGDVVYAGGTARFSVSASGSQPIGYLWKTNGVILAGATNAQLVLTNVTLSMNGMTVQAVVTNRVATTNSALAHLTVLAPYGYAGSVVADAPAAFWRLGEAAGPTAYDEFGSHNGTANGSVLFGQPGAMANDADTAYGFDGSSSVVEVPYSADLNPATFSVECWAKVAASTAQYQAAVSARDYLAGYIIYASPANVWQFWTRAPAVGWQTEVGVPVTLGQWTHLVGTFDGTNKNFYIDGVLVATQVNTNYQPNLIQNFRIGEGNNEGGATVNYNFNGEVDDVAVYGYPLSADRITYHYLLGVYSTNTAPLIVQPPAGTTVGVGQPAGLTVLAGGSPPLGYQWLKNGAAIPGATTSQFQLATTAYTDNGAYTVTISNSLGLTNTLPVSLAVMPPPLFANLTNGLVLHLKFDGDYTDASGHTNDATPLGAPTIVAGKIGSGAMHFDTDTANGIYNYATLGTPADLQFGTDVDFSVAYWARFTGTPGDLPFFCNAINSYGGYGFTFAPAYTNGGWSWSLGWGTASVGVYGPANSINDGNWHSLVHSFTRTGLGVTYLDGVQVDARSIAAAAVGFDSGATVNIGQDPTGLYAVSGAADIDDLGVWHRALNAYEAQTLYTVGQTYSRSFDSYGPVVLRFQPTAGGLALIWQAGTLLQADSLSGPWSPVSGATAPYYVAPTSSAHKFYRVAE